VTSRRPAGLRSTSFWNLAGLVPTSTKSRELSWTPGPSPWAEGRPRFLASSRTWHLEQRGLECSAADGGTRPARAAEAGLGTPRHRTRLHGPDCCSAGWLVRRAARRASLLRAGLGGLGRARVDELRGGPARPAARRARRGRRGSRRQAAGHDMGCAGLWKRGRPGGFGRSGPCGGARVWLARPGRSRSGHPTRRPTPTRLQAAGRWREGRRPLGGRGIAVRGTGCGADGEARTSTPADRTGPRWTSWAQTAWGQVRPGAFATLGVTEFPIRGPLDFFETRINPVVCHVRIETWYRPTARAHERPKIAQQCRLPYAPSTSCRCPRWAKLGAASRREAAGGPRGWGVGFSDRRGIGTLAGRKDFRWLGGCGFSARPVRRTPGSGRKSGGPGRAARLCGRMGRPQGRGNNGEIDQDKLMDFLHKVRWRPRRHDGGRQHVLGRRAETRPLYGCSPSSPDAGRA